MDTALTLKQFRRQSWAAMLQEQAESGLTVREWCRQNSISTKGFYYRRQQVQEEILRNTGPQFAELVLPEPDEGNQCQDPAEPPCFTPQLTISLNGVSVAVNEATPQQLLAKVLEVIRNA